MNKFAKIIRVITTPTALFFIMLFIMFFVKPAFFPSAAELWIPMCFIGIFPLIAYFVSFIIRKIKNPENDDYREIQRKLAFFFSVVGYFFGFVLSLSLNLNCAIIRITAIYFFSVIILSVFNLCRRKASGHACGISGPMLILCYHIGWLYIFPCIIVYILSFWSSVFLKRHTVTQFILGTLSAVFAFFIAILIFK